MKNSLGVYHGSIFEFKMKAKAYLSIVVKQCSAKVHKVGQAYPNKVRQDCAKFAEHRKISILPNFARNRTLHRTHTHVSTVSKRLRPVKIEKMKNKQ